MQQSYFGSLEAINDQRNIEILKTASRLKQNSPQLFLRRKQKEHFQSLQELTSTEVHEVIKVNISGKTFEISTKDLAKYPDSLLSDESRRKAFYDSKKKEYFLDHNRIIANSVVLFYQYGCLELPENIPEHLFIEELNFYGLYEYLDDQLKAQFITLYNTSDSNYGNNFRDNLWNMFESPEGVGINPCARVYNIFSLSSIMFSIFLLCYATYDNDQNLKFSSNFFDNVSESWVLLSELLCIGFFSVELFLRFIVTHEKRQFFHSFLNIVDFVAIAPFYIGLFLDAQHITAPLTVLRVLRIGKIFRVLKISRYNTSLLIIAKTVRSGRWDLWMLNFLLMILILFFGSCTYYVEQIFVGEESQFESIPIAIWWALITTLSIGYGNMVPKSTVGRIFGSLCAVSGIIVVAPILPIIFNRWTRFNRLHQEAKIHKKCKRIGTKNIQQDIEHLSLIRVQETGKKGRLLF